MNGNDLFVPHEIPLPSRKNPKNFRNLRAHESYFLYVIAPLLQDRD
jgi:hypothetical protein